MDLKGTVTLKAGEYYLGGDLNIGSNATVTGTGVTLYMEDGAAVKINGSSTITMSAPTSGDYQGILFFGDRDSTETQTFNGSASMHLTGNLYFPNQTVTYKGNYGGNDGCTFIVADKVEISGSTNLGVGCPTDMPRPKSFQVVKIVE